MHCLTQYEVKQLIDIYTHGVWQHAMHDTLQLNSAVEKGKQQQRDNVITGIGKMSMSILSAVYDHVVSLYTFAVYGDWMESGQRVVWRDGVKYPAMYEYLFQLIKRSRLHIDNG